MDRRIWLVIGIIAVIVIAGSVLEIHGYSGLEATSGDINHSYPHAQETKTETSLSVDPVSFQSIEGIPIDVTGLRCSWGQPGQIGTRDPWQNSAEERLSNGTLVKEWQVSIIEMEMGISVSTSGAGDAIIQDVTFSIELRENPHSVFQTADETRAYIINVYTREMTQFNIPLTGMMEVWPTAKGEDFPVDPLSSEPVPQWILDSGYTKELKSFLEVAFAINVVKARPGGAWIFRAESQAQIAVGVDVLLFGYWEELRPYREYDLFVTIWEMIQQYLVVVAGFVAMVILVVVLPGRWKIIGPILFVLTLFYSLGYLEQILQGLSFHVERGGALG